MADAAAGSCSYAPCNAARHEPHSTQTTPNSGTAKYELIYRQTICRATVIYVSYVASVALSAADTSVSHQDSTIIKYVNAQKIMAQHRLFFIGTWL